VALAPIAGVVGLSVSLAMAGGARLAGRNGRVAAIVAGYVAYLGLFVAEHADASRLAGLGLLFLVVLARWLATRPRAVPG
jgi:hypothetical protein